MALLRLRRLVAVPFAVSTVLAFAPSVARADEPPAPADASPPAAPAVTSPAAQAAPTASDAPVASTPNADAAATRADAPKKPKAPYSVPWQLRGAGPSNVVRFDNSFASYENAASAGGFTWVSALTLGAKVLPSFGLFGRLTTAQDSPPKGNGGFIMANPLFGAVYGLSLPMDLRFAAYFSAALPVGGGGGNSPSAGTLDARSAGPAARMAMENSIFAVNDYALIPGIDLAYVAHGITVQLEATFFQLWRARGDAVQHEATKTNFTSGLHVGYFVAPSLSIGGELRYQHWLNPPFGAPGKDMTADDPRIDQASFGVGPRGHFKVGDDVWIRPGIAYSRGLDKPLAGATPNVHVVQVDVPINF